MTEIQEKILFVAELSNAIIKVQHNIINLEYQVFHNTKYDYIDEVLVINYKGGAKSIRNCTGNSCSAIFEEIANKLTHGYYSELKWYDAIINDTDFERVYQ